MGDTNEILVRIQDLRVHYASRRGIFGRPDPVKAVDGVSLDIRTGETLGLVGESGCGKTTLGRAILRLIEPTSGKIFFDGRELTGQQEKAMRAQRRHFQIIFQDSYASLDPRMSVGSIIGEPMRVASIEGSVEDRVTELMKLVGLDPSLGGRYPSEISGGQRQRVGIARALSVGPKFIVADEPISALDASIQAQIMNLMRRLQAELGLTYLFISHDLRAVEYLSDRIAVMYLGQVVELGDGGELYTDPLMPYTQSLISAVSVADPARQRQRIILNGEMPNAFNPPPGCYFHTRCPYAIEACARVSPALVEIKPKHFAACIRIDRERPDIKENASKRLGSLCG